MVCVGCGFETPGKNQPRYVCLDCSSIQDVDVRRYCLNLEWVEDPGIPDEILVVPSHKPYGYYRGHNGKFRGTCGFNSATAMWSQ